jgi:hypothetical protein
MNSDMQLDSEGIIFKVIQRPLAGEVVTQIAVLDFSLREPVAQELPHILQTG